MMTKITISITPELDAALNLASLELNTPKSRLVENYLRENGVVRSFVEEVRDEPKGKALAVPTSKKKELKRAS